MLVLSATGLHVHRCFFCLIVFSTDYDSCIRRILLPSITETVCTETVCPRHWHSVALTRTHNNSLSATVDHIFQYIGRPIDCRPAVRSKCLIGRRAFLGLVSFVVVHSAFHSILFILLCAFLCFCPLFPFFVRVFGSDALFFGDCSRFDVLCTCVGLVRVCIGPL